MMLKCCCFPLLCLYFPPGSWFLFALAAFFALFASDFFSCSRLLLLYIHSSAHWCCCCCTHTIFRRQLVYFDLNCIDAQIISYLQYIFKRNEEIKRERKKKQKWISLIFFCFYFFVAVVLIIFFELPSKWEHVIELHENIFNSTMILIVLDFLEILRVCMTISVSLHAKSLP